MKTLKMSEDCTSKNTSPTPKQQQQRERKTRISFELHPSLLLEEEFLYNNEADNYEDINLEDLLQ